VCGRFISTSPIDVLARTFEVDEVTTDPASPRYNVAPTQQVLAVAARHGRRHGGPLVRALGMLRWGLVPPWAQDPSVGNRMINARAESISTRVAYRDALVSRRCLIPADAFYEWESRPGQKTKQPWAISLESGKPMAFAGLWEVWRDRAKPDGEPLRTCVIITTEANAALNAIHDRMPVVLGRERWDHWLDPAFGDRKALQRMLVPAPADRFITMAVSLAVNTVANDGPELLDAPS
jgi:putative SOS response-associated peptidase YedK